MLLYSLVYSTRSILEGFSFRISGKLSRMHCLVLQDSLNYSSLDFCSALLLMQLHVFAAERRGCMQSTVSTSSVRRSCHAVLYLLR